MAKKEEQIEEVKDNKPEEKRSQKRRSFSKPKKSKIPTKSYVVKNRVKVSGEWKEKGQKINLTEEGYRFFRSKKIV